MNLQKWQKISVIVMLTLSLGGAAFAIEQYFAKQSSHEKLVAIVEKADKKYATIEDVLATNKRITKNSLQDDLYKTQQRLWQFEDRFNKTKDETLRRVIQDLKDKINTIKQKLLRLETDS